MRTPAEAADVLADSSGSGRCDLRGMRVDEALEHAGHADAGFTLDEPRTAALAPASAVTQTRSPASAICTSMQLSQTRRIRR